ncbi:MAG: alpha/beta hydrolase [Methylovirgula sp.]|uniref:alpha/beta hydrolase n=1 Tax=Methylovirgula sp. TaxID=1978224 RepID=UPI003075F294
MFSSLARLGLRRWLPAVLALVCMDLMMGCAARPESGFLATTAYEAPSATEHTILIASTRERDARPGTLYSGFRADWLDYASATMSVPPTHVDGKIEWPQTPPGDPRRDFAVRDAGYIDGDRAFLATVNAELAKRPPGHRKIFLFVHGFNTMFAEALYGFTQVVHDAHTDHVPVLFTWASRGKLTDYLYDNNSATAARDQLAHTIRLLTDSNAEEVNILAHSMGNWVFVEAMRQIKMQGGLKHPEKIGLVLLAAPDIDIDVFKSDLRAYGKLKKPYYIVLSKDDKALALSKFLAGGQTRVGDDGNVQDLAKLGAVVIDLTNVHGDDPTDHNKYAQIAAIAPQLEHVLQSGIEKNHVATSDAADQMTSTLGAVVSVPVNIMGNSFSIVSSR